MQLNSEPNKGSTFTFTVSAPKTDFVKQDDVVASNSLTDFSNKRILLVEDNFINRQVVAKMLEPSEATLTMAEDGLEALDLLKKESFDLILMDCQMPNMDGYECTIAIREYEKNTPLHVPIVAITANAYEDDKQRCLDIGMDDFVSKPVNSHELYTVIAKAFNKR